MTAMMNFCWNKKKANRRWDQLYQLKKKNQEDMKEIDYGVKNIAKKKRKTYSEVLVYAKNK